MDGNEANSQKPASFKPRKTEAKKCSTGLNGWMKLLWGIPVISYIDRQGPECTCLLMKVVECLEMAVELDAMRVFGVGGW